MSKQVSVSIVRDGGYAESVGIKPKDLIYRINGLSVCSCHHVTDAISGGNATFTIIRGSKLFDVQIISSSLGVVLDEVDFDEDEWNTARLIDDVVLSTAQTIPGKEIVKTIGVVGSQCVYGLNLLADIMAGVRDMAGGRSTTLQNALSEARETASAELKSEAHKAGANGVIATSFSYSEIGDKGGYMLMVTATGTAVITN